MPLFVPEIGIVCAQLGTQICVPYSCPSQNRCHWMIKRTLTAYQCNLIWGIMNHGSVSLVKIASNLDTQTK